MPVIWKYSEKLIEYTEAINSLEKQVNEIINGTGSETIWQLEHSKVYTAGISSKKSDLLKNPNNIPVYNTSRGGKYTYHGPGMAISYIMLDLTKHKRNIREFIYKLEETIINILNKLGIEAFRRKDRIGIWVIDKTLKECKIAAIGIRIRRWVTYHGIAFNINPQLSDFNNIIPCGIKKYGVTSLEQLGINLTMTEYREIFKQEFQNIFYI